MSAVVYKTNQRIVWAGLIAAINILRFGNFIEVRRIKYDFIMCYKILNSEVSLNCNFFDLSALTYTRSHKYKLYKKQSSISAYKFFSNRICDIWNALGLTNFVFDVSSSNSCRRLLDKVDLSQFTVLL